MAIRAVGMPLDYFSLAQMTLLHDRHNQRVRKSCRLIGRARGDLCRQSRKMLFGLIYSGHRFLVAEYVPQNPEELFDYQLSDSKPCQQIIAHHKEVWQKP